MTEDLRAALSRIGEIIADYWETSADARTPVVDRLPPSELERRLAVPDLREGASLERVFETIETYLRYAVRTSHPQYFNQLWAGVSLPALLGDIVASAANTSMYTYEVAPAATVLERELIRRMGLLAGFPDADGQLVTGGSNGNLLAMALARMEAVPDSRRCGVFAGPPLRGFISADAHYSFDTAANVLGLGTDCLRRIPTDHRGRMNPAALLAEADQARRDGAHPFFVGATAGTTVLGAFDPLPELADIAARHHMWLHVDGAWGGAVVFSRRHRDLLAGLERADSFVWDWHKMLGLPLIVSAFLVKKKGLRQKAFGPQDAGYIYHDDEHSADLGPLAIQCGRAADVLKLVLDWQYWGDQGYAERVDRFFELARYAAEVVSRHPDLELMAPVESANVCFRIVPPDPDDDANEYNRAVRNRLAAGGRALVNYGNLGTDLVLRLVVANRRVERRDIDEFFRRLLAAAAEQSDAAGHASREETGDPANPLPGAS